MEPTWLTLSAEFGGVGVSAGDGAVTYTMKTDFPRPHLASDGPIHIPDAIPFIGGAFGLLETYGTITGQVSSIGTGSLSVGGTTGFTAGGSTLLGSVSGERRSKPASENCEAHSSSQRSSCSDS